MYPILFDTYEEAENEALNFAWDTGSMIINIFSLNGCYGFEFAPSIA